MPPPRATTLLERIAWRAEREPRREAFRFAGRSRTFGDLWRDVDRFAGALLGDRLKRGDRVVIALENGPDFFTAFYGTLRARGVAVPVHPDVGAAHLVTIARRCRAARVVCPPGVAVPPGATALTVEGLLARGERREAASMPEPRDLAYIQYTSGSTGEPKGVQVRHAALLLNAEQMIEGMRITDRDVFVSWLPVCHDMGLVLMTMVPFYLGARLSLFPASLRHIRSWLAEIARRKGTFIAAPDFAYRLVLRHVTDPERYDLSSLRVALNAAEPVRPATLRGFESAFGLDRVMIPGYGLAEATVGVSSAAPGAPIKIDERGFPSVGRGFPGVELGILARGRLAENDQIGEILVKSGANTDGYWHDPDASRELFDPGGYLRTGDLGYLDRDGDLFVVGRIKNVIIQGGRNIAPREIESLLDAFDSTRLSAAVGVDRGGDAGEQVYAFIELRGGRARERDALRRRVVEATARIRSRLGLATGRIYLVRPRTIPLTHNGKIRHAELRRRYLDGSLRREGKLLFPDY